MKAKNNNKEFPNLTQQENTLIRDFCEDCLSQKEVADRRNISINTVQTHQKNIFRKLNITKITQLSKMYFTMYLMLICLSVTGVARVGVRMSIRYQPIRANITRTHRRSRRRMDDSTFEFKEFYLPITV